MCSLDLDYAKVWNEAPHIARKTHTCDACRATIPKGDAYLHHSSLYDGRWTTEAMCFPCWWVRAVFAEAHGQSFIPGMLMEMLQECASDDGDGWRGELAFVLRRYRTSKAGRARLRRRWANFRMVRARLTQLSPARSDN